MSTMPLKTDHDHRRRGATVVQCTIALLVLLLLGVAGLIAFGGDTRAGRFLGQELASFCSGKGKARAERHYRERLESFGVTPAGALPEVLVKKREHLCLLLDRGRVLATFPIALGANPVGQKETIDDSRTPEGSYQICYKKENSRYHLFIGLSYPSPTDAARAFSAGRITASESEAILDAALNHQRPPWNTALGGPFGLHGFGAGNDWTEGTIAMANGHIEELYWNLPMGTRVTVVP